MVDKLTKERPNFGVGKSIILIVIAYLCKKTMDSGDPFYYAIPNMLLFFPAPHMQLFLWDMVIPKQRSLRYPKNFDQKHIPILTKEEFSFEAMQKATQNFQHPAMVKGYFNGTEAMKKWPNQKYLRDLFGDFDVPYVRSAKYNTQQDDRGVDKFGPLYDEVLTNTSNRYYLFFPVLSRHHFNGSDIGAAEKLRELSNKVIHDDLELDRIWPGFGTSTHTTHKGSQFIFGRGGKSFNDTTGTGWHSEAGNNWFAQIMGRKRWMFVDPKYSSIFKPLRGGSINMQMGKTLTKKEWIGFPYRYADLEPGDFLYNPDWYWHSIHNYEGFTLVCPMREFNRSISWRNNAQYTSIIILNKLANKYGLEIGGYGTIEVAKEDE